jgi:integrase/recombinase XerD
MRLPRSHPIPATAAPTTEDMLRVWRADRCVQSNSAGLYLQWIRRFRAYCAQCQLDERAELTLASAHRFITWYARYRHLNPKQLGGARTALYALTRVYQVMGLSLPAWLPARHARPPATALLRAYADQLARCRGNPERTANKKLDHVTKLGEYLTGRGKTWRAVTLV